MTATTAVAVMVAVTVVAAGMADVAAGLAAADMVAGTAAVVVLLAANIWVAAATAAAGDNRSEPPFDLNDRHGPNIL